MSYEGVYDFYRDRIAACPLYGFKAGSEILDLIVRCAWEDKALTTDEFNSIIMTANECHIKLLEDNYNERWK